jgi:hypothetical protein
VFHQFWQAKFACGGSILSLTQIQQLTKLPQKNRARFKNGQN